MIGVILQVYQIVNGKVFEGKKKNFFQTADETGQKFAWHENFVSAAELNKTQNVTLQRESTHWYIYTQVHTRTHKHTLFIG